MVPRDRLDWAGGNFRALSAKENTPRQPLAAGAMFVNRGSRGIENVAQREPR